MSKIKNYFDQAAANYQNRSTAIYWRWLRQKESSAVMGVIGPGVFEKVLDLGCGSGYYSQLIAPQCRRLVVVDFSEKMLANVSVEAEKIAANMEDYVSHEPFDLIMCVGALEFLEDPEKIFLNVSKMLVPKGIFVLLLPRKTFLRKFYQLYHATHGINVGLFDCSEIETWAVRGGLKIEARQKAGLFNSLLKFTKSM